MVLEQVFGQVVHKSIRTQFSSINKQDFHKQSSGLSKYRNILKDTEISTYLYLGMGWMFKHYLKHQFEETKKGEMVLTFEVIQFFRPTFERQVSDAVDVRMSSLNPKVINCNSNMEYCRILVPDIRAPRNEKEEKI